MTVDPIPPLPPTLRGVGFVPAFVPATVPQAPQALFARVLETSAATGAPLPATAPSGAAIGANPLSLLDRALFRDLVGILERVPASPGAIGPGALPLVALDPDAVLRGGVLPDALRELGAREAGLLASTLVSLFGTIQALGDDSGDDTPRLGALLNVFA
jgi:hypothetical protein